MKYKLSEIFDSPISGEWGTELQEGQQGYKVIRTTNFTNQGRLNLSDIVSRNIDIDKCSKKVLQVGDIIIEKSGGSPNQPVGRVVFFDVTEDEYYFCNNFTAILRPKEFVYPKYGLYLMKMLYIQRKVLKFQNKTTGIINLKLNDYLNQTSINLPSFETQERIANILDQAQELIDKRKAQIEALDELIQSLFYDMFGDPRKSDYTRFELQDICNKLTDGTHFSPPNVEYGVPYITAKHVDKSGLNFYKNPTYISLEDHKVIYERCNPEQGDVVYIKDGATTGIAAINLYNFEFSMLSSLALLKLKSELVNNQYLVCYLNNPSIKRAILNNMVGGAIKRLTLTRMKKIIIVLPPIELQNQFAEMVENIEKQKALLNESLVELENNFNSLMQRAFKGELFS